MPTGYEFNAPPIKNSTFTFDVALVSTASTNVFKVAPTLAAGDVLVSGDGSTPTGIAVLPVHKGSGLLAVALTANEMNYNRVGVIFHDVTGTAGSEWQDLMIAFQTYQAVTYPSAADNADAVWDETLAGHLVAGSTGEKLNNTNTTTPPTVGAIADQVWDEALAGHLGAGSTGEKLNNTNTTTPPTANAVADQVWDELLAGHAIVGSAGAALSTAGAATDPLLNIVPGSYAAGTAGSALGRIGSGQIVTTSIVAQDATVTTYQGDDYKNVDGKAIDWTDTSVSWPVLTAATITVVIDQIGSFTGSVVTATGASKKVRLELTAAQNTFIGKNMQYQVIATLSNGDVVTLVDARWNSIDRKTLV